MGLLALRGAVRGFFRESFGLAAVGAGLAAAVAFGAGAGRAGAARWGLDPQTAGVLAHAGLFLVPFVALQAVGIALHRLGRAVCLGGLDRAAGAALGAAAGVLLCGAGVALLESRPWGAQWLGGSRLAPALADAFRRAAAWAASLTG